jgi:hypothetical protein
LANANSPQTVLMKMAFQEIRIIAIGPCIANQLHVEVLHNFKRKKYNTVCGELAFAKSPSTEWS